MHVMTGDRRTARVAGALACWSAGALALWLGARAVCPEAACRVPELDRNGLAAIHRLRGPWFDTIMAASTWLGSIVVLAPGAAALAWSRWRDGRHDDARVVLAGLGGAWLLAQSAKLLVARPRPDLHEALVAMPSDLSFPSAHTMQVAAFALTWLLTSPARPGPIAIAAAIFAVLLVAVSRLYLQVHFPTDVIVAAIAGVAWVWGLRLLLDKRT